MPGPRASPGRVLGARPGGSGRGLVGLGASAARGIGGVAEEHACAHAHQAARRTRVQSVGGVVHRGKSVYARQEALPRALAAHARRPRAQAGRAQIGARAQGRGDKGRIVLKRWLPVPESSRRLGCRAAEQDAELGAGCLALGRGTAAPGLESRQERQGGLVVGAQHEPLLLEALRALDGVSRGRDTGVEFIDKHPGLNIAQVGVGCAQAHGLGRGATHHLRLILIERGEFTSAR